MFSKRKLRHRVCRESVYFQGTMHTLKDKEKATLLADERYKSMIDFLALPVIKKLMNELALTTLHDRTPSWSEWKRMDAGIYYLEHTKGADQERFVPLKDAYAAIAGSVFVLEMEKYYVKTYYDSSFNGVCDLEEEDGIDSEENESTRIMSCYLSSFLNLLQNTLRVASGNLTISALIPVLCKKIFVFILKKRIQRAEALLSILLIKYLLQSLPRMMLRLLPNYHQASTQRLSPFRMLVTTLQIY